MKIMITSQVLDYFKAKYVQYVTTIYNLFPRLTTLNFINAKNKPSLNYFDRYNK